LIFLCPPTETAARDSCPFSTTESISTQAPLSKETHMTPAGTDGGQMSMLPTHPATTVPSQQAAGGHLGLLKLQPKGL
jgi:hypothetical protein